MGRMLIAGSRNLKGSMAVRELFALLADEAEAGGFEIVTGDAFGADQLAAAAGLEAGLTPRVFSVVPACKLGSRFAGCSVEEPDPRALMLPWSCRLALRTRLAVEYVAKPSAADRLAVVVSDGPTPGRGSALACKLALQARLPLVVFFLGLPEGEVPTWQPAGFPEAEWRRPGERGIWGAGWLRCEKVAEPLFSWESVGNLAADLLGRLPCFRGR